MIWLRFYYFTFLYHYWNKPETWVGSFRSLLLVELSLFWLFLSLWLIIDPGFLLLSFWTKPAVLIFNILLLALLYWKLMHKGKSETIFEEFKGHYLNTNANRIICWTVWAGSFLSFLISAFLQSLL